MKIKFNLNGEECVADVSPDKRALDFLRDDMRMLSVKEGCGEGECGACTIIVNDKAYASCLMLAVELDGKNVLTLEGLQDKDEDYIQKAFLKLGAVQCGFCTPGMIMSSKALLDKNPDPSDDEIKTALEGNLCRCTGYVKIFEAVKEAAKSKKK